ncbi:coiled-coil domain-containing protein 71 [Latimeria chalumnae]|uniref:Coiled-coil domain containing 71 n=1 Tax=Latimeria chalumnae TaxID=7897 RepID=H3ARY6_LATCH|nr:PREDICTED: coiled-coil domain-containing protein 71 [Latimeria chalumnae]XP_014350200.1 PREDICTED: coiled-coil domain-containing protein 71 [Latimeria chalumnae]|eukprot:XP_014350199.1 PREDICTED: coiled-coil domain-containing protein 71 [Latimeria chalumnae]
MNFEDNNTEKKAVHAWSRISSAGQKVFEEVLKVFSPMSKDLTNTETQLVSFLQGLKEEGYQPQILRSKDVYGYSSCMARTPSPIKKILQDRSKTPTGTTSRVPSKKAELICSNSEKAMTRNSSLAKDQLKQLPKKNSMDLSKNSVKLLELKNSNSKPLSIPSKIQPGKPSAMKLSIVLETETSVLLKSAAAAQQQSIVSFGSSASIPLKLPRVSVMLGKPLVVDMANILPSLQYEPKGDDATKKLSSSLNLDTGSLTGLIVKKPNGRVLKESNACKASGVLNGRISNGASETPNNNNHNLKDTVGKIRDSNGKSMKKPGGNREVVGQKRKRLDGSKETSQQKKAKHSVLTEKILQDGPELGKSKKNFLRCKFIKVGRKSTDDEVRKKAQKILRVNLSPVIKIRPLISSPST